MKTLSSLLAIALALPLAAQEPTAEHQRLSRLAGTWDAAMEHMGEDGKPVKSTGVSVRKMPLGGFWLMDNFQAKFMGMDFRGMGTTGYDPAKKKYVATWVDSMTPSLMVMEGTYDKSGKVLTMTGKGPNFDGTALVQHRHVITTKGANKEVFEMFVAGPDGKDIPTMTITYTRRVRKVDEVGK